MLYLFLLKSCKSVDIITMHLARYVVDDQSYEATTYDAINDQKNAKGPSGLK